MYYILKIEGETAKRFNTFEELTRFMVKYTFYYNFFTDSSLDELLDSRVGFDKMKYGYRNTHLRNDILEGYNLTGKEREISSLMSSSTMPERQFRWISSGRAS